MEYLLQLPSLNNPAELAFRSESAVSTSLPGHRTLDEISELFLPSMNCSQMDDGAVSPVYRIERFGVSSDRHAQLMCVIFQYVFHMKNIGMERRLQH